MCGRDTFVLVEQICTVEEEIQNIFAEEIRLALVEQICAVVEEIQNTFVEEIQFVLVEQICAVSSVVGRRTPPLIFLNLKNASWGCAAVDVFKDRIPPIQVQICQYHYWSTCKN